ncbi:MAG: hypothetical protein F4213_13140 [Boseongicola sp. SB0677_bin_26]|nr:hypothetical protein [Boseongicola sp. SB0665_bin_10]MYG26945.1 hypothetical protein [Boseongicola sp. SB0677_bin_26]
MPDPATSFVEDYERREKRLRIEDLNTRIDLKRILGSRGAASVTATYEGYGDSGNVTALAVRGNDAAIVPELDDALGERLKDFCWDVAYAEHPGFEIDAGASGEIRWNLQEDRMELDHHSRLEDSQPYPAEDLYRETPEHLKDDERFKRLVTRRDELVRDLSAMGVTSVIATYDAYGDSGNVEHVAVKPDNVVLDDKLRELMMDFCWDVAYTEHPGFEIDAGGSGEVRWNVQADRIDLDHYSNFEDSVFTQNDDVGRALLDEVRGDPDLYHVHPETGEITFMEDETPRDELSESKEDADATPGLS